MKILISYKTKFGGSKQHAEWLAEAFECRTKVFGDVAKEEEAFILKFKERHLSSKAFLYFL